ncbi:MaoC family dehydratase [Sphingobium sp. R-21]|uniref:MaoC family dehydratase n=1 Tax=Sphingobium sp. R-21 TaxID=3404056 RepID=UPI003CF2576C
MSDDAIEGQAARGRRTLWLEDMAPGRTFRFGDYAVERDEVVAFARKYDPQPFHIDDAAAATSVFGRLCASGMHTMAMAHRLQMGGFQEVGLQVLAGLGMDEFRLSRPVFPGDSLHMEIEIGEARPLESKPGRGLLRYVTRVFNQKDEVVLTYLSTLMMACRPIGA